MKTFRGVGGRMKERLRALGYVKPDGELEVQRFVLDFRYHQTQFYAWLRDARTPFKDLDRLARDLQTTPPFLIFGVAAPAPMPPKALPARTTTARATRQRDPQPVAPMATAGGGTAASGSAEDPRRPLKKDFTFCFLSDVANAAGGVRRAA